MPRLRRKAKPVPPLAKGSPVIIVWEDAWFENENYDAARTQKKWIVETIGLLMEIDAHKVVVSFEHFRPDGQYRTYQSIPIGMVQEIHELTTSTIYSLKEPSDAVRQP